MSTQSPTPETDNILEYLHFQFPPTKGHIPLRQKIERLERERDEANRQLAVYSSAIVKIDTISIDGADCLESADETLAEIHTIAANAIHDASHPPMPGMEKEPCTWTPDEWDIYQTTCGNEHEFMNSTPSDNLHKFCPYCGKPIAEKPSTP